MPSNKGLDALKEKWATMPTSQRSIFAAVAVLATVMLVGSLFFKDLTPPKKRTDSSASDLMLPGSRGEITNEVLASKIDSLMHEQSKLTENQKTENDNVARIKQQMVDPMQLQQLQQQVTQLQIQKSAPVSVPAPAPGPVKPADPLADPALNLPLNQVPGGTPAESVPVAPTIRVLGEDPQNNKQEADKEETITPYLPIGSMFDGILLNGMEAPTSQVTMKNPVPALVRIKSDAILPNEYRKDVRECFMIVSGFGVLSTERAQLRTENLSCVRKDGGIIESKINGYVIGEDGKVGMRGRLVSKQGQLIAQSLMVGFVQGIGNAMQPMAVPAFNMSPGNTQQYQMPSMSMMAMSGMAGGVSNAANSIAQFYMSMAQQMFPVVEIDAGRKITIVLTKGFKFDLSGKYSKGTKTVQTVDVQQGPVQPATAPAPVSLQQTQPGMPSMGNVGMPQGTAPQMQYAQ